MSSRQLIDSAIVDTVADALALADLEPSALCLEVTESAVLVDEPVVETILARLVDLGVQLAIDDFGTGHATLEYLQRIPAATLKIDKQFVRPLPDDPDAVELVRGIVDLAHTVGKTVVAEGVESTGQADVLRSVGCDFLQGYLISKPLDEADFESLFAAAAGVPLLEPAEGVSATSATRSVVVVDTELAIVGAIRAAMAAADIEVAGTATSIDEATTLLGRLQPDVVLSERNLPDGDATDALDRYRDAAPDAAVVIFTGKPDERSLSRALDRGARGYIDKHNPFDELLAAIEQVAGGEVCVSPHLLSLLTRRHTSKDDPALTERELDVLDLLARGRSTGEMANELFLSVNTVRNHIARLLRKLDARTRLEAVAIAADLGIVHR